MHHPPIRYQSLPPASNQPADWTPAPIRSDDEGFPPDLRLLEDPELLSDTCSVEFTGGHFPTLDLDDDSDSDAVAVSMLQTRLAKPSSHVPSDRITGDRAQVGETIPRAALTVFGRRFATPCRGRLPVHHIDAVASQSRARDASATAAEPALTALPVRRPHTPVSTPVVLSLAAHLPVKTGTVSRPLQIGATLEDLLQSVACLGPDMFLRDFTVIPGLHDTAKTWASSLPPWDGAGPLQSLVLYTDGSYQSDTGRAAWAIVATGLCSGSEVFVGFIGDRLWTSDHPHYVCQEQVDAHSAELVALLHAVACVASLDNMPVVVYGDCTSALDIASASACSKAHARLSGAVLDLHVIAVQRGNAMSFQHVPSHRGTPGNEFADSAAKAIAAGRLNTCLDAAQFGAMVRQGKFSWLWWTVTSWCQSGVVPGLTEDGRTMMDAFPTLPRFHQCGSLPGLPTTPQSSLHARKQAATWTIRTATYNANSLKKEADRQLLDRFLSQQLVHFAGVQESRHYAGPRTCTAHYHCYCSADKKGNLGCQIWLSASLPVATRADGSVVTLDVGNVTVVHASERMLAICVQAGDILFGIVTAHAPISAAPEDERIEWWDCLRGVFRRLPRRAIPILLADCNARFEAAGPVADVVAASAQNDNARALQQFCVDFGFGSANLFDVHGKRCVTWTSPYGNPTQLDYILWPVSLAAESRTLALNWHQPSEPDFDHRPLVADTTWTSDTSCPPSRARWNLDKMRTDEGRRLLRHAFETIPLVPWTYDVDDHLQIINNHLHGQLLQHFPAVRCRPRQAHISDEQWQAIMSRRHCRRLITRSKRLRDKHLTAFVLQAWVSIVGKSPSPSAAAHRCRQRRSRMHEARLGMAVRGLCYTITRMSAADAASHTRHILRDARCRGPSALYGALRGVMKIGRRYKPPRILPALCVEGEVLADPVHIQRALVKHFAEPEHGRDAAVAPIADLGAAGSGGLPEIDLRALPTVADIVQGFLRLQDNKALGASGLPAEIYRHAAIAAAIGHAPLFVKIASRQHWPVLWRGTLNAAIPKASKDGSRLQSWRSIALAEAAYKGVGKALCVHLAEGLRRLTTPGQHGSLPGENIGIPAQYVQSYVQLAHQRNRSMAVIFLDGRSAYYSTIRDFLFCHELTDPASLEELIDLLVPDEDLREEAVAALLGPGLLKMAGIHDSLADYLRASLHGTWFTMDVHAPVVQHTLSGTAPGTPLADLLYQFVQTRFMRGVMADLRECGLQAHVHLQQDAACPQGWADDIAVLLPFCDACDLEHNIRQCVPIIDTHSRRMGVSLNYDSGKTEALTVFRGKGCVAVKRRLLSPDQPALNIPVAGTFTVQLRLVESYQHLGNLLHVNASCLEDVRRKCQAADAVFKRLQKTLLRNGELTSQEKVLLVSSLVQAKIKYGSGIWLPSTSQERRSAQHALSKHWRLSCRSICSLGTKFLTESEVATVLDVLTAEETLRTERVRQLCLVASEGPGFLWHCLLEHQAWLRLAISDACCMRALLGFSAFSEMDLHSALDFVRLHISDFRRMLRPYGAACRAARAGDRAAVCAKVERITRFEKEGGVLLHVEDIPEGLYRCHVCSLSFQSRSSRAAHLSTVHGQRARVAAASGSACLVCGMEWWTTFRLREHLRRSPGCLLRYDEADLGDHAPFEHTGTRANKAWRPPTPVAGAVPWWATLWPEPTASPAVASDTIDLDGCPDEDGLRQLLASCADTSWDSWIPSAFRWVRLHSWCEDWAPTGCPAQSMMQVLGGIAERATDGRDTDAIVHGGVKALRTDRLWWIQPC